MKNSKMPLLKMALLKMALLKRPLITLACAILVVGTLALHLSAKQSIKKESHSKDSQLSSLSFLKGNWKAKKWGGEFHAHYATPSGGKLLSYSELRAGGKVGFHEFEKFEEAPGGKLKLTPYPGGKAAASFHSSHISKTKVVFDNPKKDFPTQITYERISPLILRITLADPHSGSKKTDVFELNICRPEGTKKADKPKSQ